MDIDEKLKEFYISIEYTMNKEYREIERSINREIDSSIKEELATYEAKKQINYDRTVQRIEKEYNKKVFNYEMQCKKEIIDEEKKLKNQIKEIAIEKLREFTKSDKYQFFFIKSIEDGISKFDDMNDISIGITKTDMEKYKHMAQKYSSKLKEINEKYIGGCILENEKQGMFIDNTLKNCIDERLKG